MYAAGFTTGAGLAACAAGLTLAAFVPGLPGLLGAAITIGLGTALITPLGFAALAASAPEGRLGQTMGAAEVGRELGDAGGPLLVGVIAAATLTGGLAALAAPLALGAGITVGAHQGRSHDTATP